MRRTWPWSLHIESWQRGQQPLLANPPASVPVADERWANLRDVVFAEALLPAIAQMEQEQWPLPDAGYELADDRGKVIAEAELAWPQARVAVLITDDDQDACVQAGWYAFTVEEFLAATVTTQDRSTIKDRLQGA